ncbi:SH3 domain-binding glutamic acid-rich-like protein 3 [Antennarius striatus]|uniref:SH3 domain-binding glutamic acid-rich-like protein 3 n=1 Tax=Antennarius striatus TaxID=241820 RepID=UPI0035B48497
MSDNSDIKVYYSSASGNLKMDKQQQFIFNVLDGQKILYKRVDVDSREVRESMRHLAGNEAALPPQVFNGDQYCGDYQSFFDKVECSQLMEFLKLKDQH